MNNTSIKNIFLRLIKLFKRIEPSVLVYIISVDTIFVNKLMMDFASNTNYDVILRESGEGFFKEITFNPLPRRTIPVVILDYELQSHHHQDTRDGIEILEEIIVYKPNWDVVVLSKNDNKLLKSKAMKKGAAAFVVKNENSIVRLRNHIYNLMNQQKMKLEKQFTILSIAIFFTILSLFLLIFALFFYKQNML